MNRTEPTPIGQSAVSAGQARPKQTDEEAPVLAGSGERVAGPTPIGQSASSSPPAPEPVDPANVAIQRRRNVDNLAILARQAISNGFDSMQCKPQMVADLCVEFARIETSKSDAAVAPPDGALDTAKEEGRREAIAEFAGEKAELLQRIADMEAAAGQGSAPAVESIPETPTPEVGGTDHESFRGPGQQG